MFGRRGQATVEAVGIALAVAIALGTTAAVIGGTDAPSRIARAVAGAFAGDRADRAAPGQASAGERAAAAAAFRPAARPDERPSLAGLRLRMSRRLGAVAGARAFEQLLLAEAQRELPGARTGARVTIDAALRDRLHVDVPARAGMSFWLEETVGPPRVGLAERSLQDAYVHDRLAPDASEAAIDLGLDLVDLAAFVPGPGTLLRALRAGAWVVGAVRTASAIEQLGRGPLPPGARADDVVVMWRVRRTAHRGDGSLAALGGTPVPAQDAERLAVIRGGVVISNELLPQRLVTHP